MVAVRYSSYTCWGAVLRVRPVCLTALWNTASITSLTQGFYTATLFNSNIGALCTAWNVASLISMNNAFNGASGFNQNLGGWKTASVTDMGWMFNDAASFNQNLAAWNVLGVTAASGVPDMGLTICMHSEV